MAKNETAFTGVIESFLWKDNKSNHALIKLKNVSTIDSSLPESLVCSGTFGDLKPGMKILGKGSARENRQNFSGTSKQMARHMPHPHSTLHSTTSAFY